MGIKLAKTAQNGHFWQFWGQWGASNGLFQPVPALNDLPPYSYSDFYQKEGFFF